MVAQALCCHQVVGSKAALSRCELRGVCADAMLSGVTARPVNSRVCTRGGREGSEESTARVYIYF